MDTLVTRGPTVEVSRRPRNQSHHNKYRSCERQPDDLLSRTCPSTEGSGSWTLREGLPKETVVDVYLSNLTFKVPKLRKVSVERLLFSGLTHLYGVEGMVRSEVRESPY